MNPSYFDPDCLCRETQYFFSYLSLSFFIFCLYPFKGDQIHLLFAEIIASPSFTKKFGLIFRVFFRLTLVFCQQFIPKHYVMIAFYFLVCACLASFVQSLLDHLQQTFRCDHLLKKKVNGESLPA
jgi:hypothetical protein